MKHRFRVQGPAAIETSAFGFMFDPPPPPKTETRDGVAIVPIRGPLEAHAGGWCDSYDAIRERVASALAAKPKALVLAIDSPGGVMGGCLELCAELRALAAKAGVPLVSYVDGKACSAAYAIACAGAEIVVPPTGVVGSIGTVAEVIDASAYDAAIGLKVHVVASGERKADGNPHLPQTEASLAAIKAHVDALAARFFDHVAIHRPITAVEARGLQAAVYVGAQGEAVGLADSVETMGALIARLSGVAAPAANGSAPAGAEEETDMTEEEKARAALQAIVDDEKSDEKAKARAKAALAAFDGDDAEDKDDEKAKGEDEQKPRDDDQKDEDAKAVAARADARSVEALRVSKVNGILAARPDLSDEQRAAFEGLEPKALQKILATIPRKAPANPAAAAQVTGTAGAGQGGTKPAADPRFAAMDRVMGLAPAESPVRRTESGVVFGALTHEQASELAKKGIGA